MDSLLHSVDEAMAKVAAFIEAVPDMLYAALAKAELYAEIVYMQMVWIWVYIQSALMAIPQKLYEGVLSLQRALTWLLSRLGDLLTRIASGLQNIAIALKNGLVALVKGLWNGLVAFVEGLWSLCVRLWSSLGDLLRALYEEVRNRLIITLIHLYDFFVRYGWSMFSVGVSLLPFLVELHPRLQMDRRVLGLRAVTALVTNIGWMNIDPTCDALTLLLLTLLSSGVFYLSCYSMGADLRQRLLGNRGWQIVVACVLCNTDSLLLLLFYRYPQAVVFMYTRYWVIHRHLWAASLACTLLAQLYHKRDTYVLGKHLGLCALLVAVNHAAPEWGPAHVVVGVAMLLEVAVFRVSSAKTLALSVVGAFFGIQLVVYALAYALVMWISYISPLSNRTFGTGVITLLAAGALLWRQFAPAKRSRLH